MPIRAPLRVIRQREQKAGTPSGSIRHAQSKSDAVSAYPWVMTFSTALRGYAHRVLARDGFRCVYCGLDGAKDFSAWLHLSWDHLLPPKHPNRDDERFIVAACRFCNEAHNRTRFPVEGKTPQQIVAMKREAILKRRAEYREFWEEHVRAE
jgi:hypothetical protein